MEDIEVDGEESSSKQKEEQSRSYMGLEVREQHGIESSLVLKHKGILYMLLKSIINLVEDLKKGRFEVKYLTQLILLLVILWAE